jgi:hypothetical protein
VDDTLRGGSIQFANRFQNSSLSFFPGARIQCGAGFRNERARAAAEDAVLNSTLLVLAISLNLRLNVCQSTSSENNQPNQGWILLDSARFVKEQNRSD